MAIDRTEIVCDNLEEITVPVRYGKVRYLLKEASAGAVVQYQDAIFKGTKFLDGKPTSLEGAGKAQTLLVSLCLFKLGPNDILLPVNQAEISKIPNKLFKQIFDRLKDISDLGQVDDTEESINKEIETLQLKLVEIREKKAEAKNDLIATGAISE